MVGSKIRIVVGVFLATAGIGDPSNYKRTRTVVKMPKQQKDAIKVAMEETT